MTRHLNLVQSDFEHLEKKVLPRFPFCYLTFKCSKGEEHIFEIKDISNSGMQLALRNGEHKLKEGETISGMIHWQSRELGISGNVKWTTPMRLGVEFSTQASSRDEVNDFLMLDKIAGALKPVHLVDYGEELPPKLKYWLRADGPVEIFVWQHNDGELSRFQIIIMENSVEWEDGKGIRTSRVISKRDMDSPLITEDEFVFKIDEHIDDIKVAKAQKLVRNIDSKNLSEKGLEFIQMKLGMN